MSPSVIQLISHSAFQPDFQPKEAVEEYIVSAVRAASSSARIMQSAGVVVLLVVVACACVISLASSSAQSGAAQPNHPRHTLLSLVRAASAFSPTYSHPHRVNQGRKKHPFSVAHRPIFNFTPIRPGNVFSEYPPSRPKEEIKLRTGDERSTWSKRASINDSLVSEEINGEELLDSIPQVGASLATNFLRHSRSSARPYDVPQIGKLNTKNHPLKKKNPQTVN